MKAGETTFKPHQIIPSVWPGVEDQTHMGGNASILVNESGIYYSHLPNGIVVEGMGSQSQEDRVEARTLRNESSL